MAPFTRSMAAAAKYQQRIQELAEHLEEAHKVIDTLNKTIRQFEVVVIRELQCSICLQVVFQPVTLSCGHTMCIQCVDQLFMLTTKCPICRTPAQMQIRPLLLDTFVDAVKPLLSVSFQEEREQIKRERMTANEPATTRTPSLPERYPTPLPAWIVRPTPDTPGAAMITSLVNFLVNRAAGH